MEEKQNPKEVHNPRGRNIYTQARRAGKNKEIDVRDEWEVERIIKERENNRIPSKMGRMEKKYLANRKGSGKCPRNSKRME